jgi:hypothetical protein
MTAAWAVSSADHVSCQPYGTGPEAAVRHRHDALDRRHRTGIPIRVHDPAAPTCRR